MTLHIGTHYDQTSDWQQAKWVELLELAEQSGIDFSSMRTILDLGCGSGRRTKGLLAYFPQAEKIVGIDSHRSMIDAAMRLHSDPRVTYLEADIAAPIFANCNSFDLVVANYSLNWVREKQRAVEALTPVVHRQTALCIATTWARPHFFSIINRAVLDYLHLPPDTEYPSYYLDVEAWKALLAHCGWQVLSTVKKSESCSVLRGHEFLRYWFAASTGRVFYGKTLEMLQPDFFDHVIDQLDAEFLQPGEPDRWVFEQTPLLIVARKP